MALSPQLILKAGQQMKAISYIDIAVIVGYLVLMVSMSFLFNKLNKDEEEYFKGGNKMPWWIAGASCFMASFSAWTFTGGAGFSYDYGFAGVLMYAMGGVSFFIGAYWLAGVWRRTRITSAMEFLETRYGLPAHQFLSWTTIPISIIYCGIFLYSISMILSYAMKTNLQMMILITGVVVLIYTVIGGFWAVCVNDTIQSLLLLGTITVVFVLSLIHVGDFHTFFTRAEELNYFRINDWQGNNSWFYLAAYLVNAIFANNSGSNAQRYYAVRDEKAAKKVALLSGVLFIAGAILWCLPPMIARIVGLDVESAASTLNFSRPEEASYIAIAMAVLPTGLVGMLIAAIFAASVTSIDSTYNYLAAILSRDVYQRVFHRDASPRAQMIIGRLSTMFIGLIVIFVASFYASIKDMGVFEIMILVSGLIVVPANVPVMIGLVYKRTPSWIAMLVMTAGLSVGLIGVYVFHLDWSLKELVTILFPLCLFLFMVPGLLTTLWRSVAAWASVAVVLVGVDIILGLQWGWLAYSLMLVPLGVFLLAMPYFNARQSEEYNRRLDAFFEKLHTPIDPAAEGIGDEEAGLSSYIVIGRISMGIGGVALLLMLITRVLGYWTTLGDGLAFVGEAAIMFLLGLGLMYLGRYRKSLKQA
jgi:solute:Na+ symporter, SSS family